MALSDVRGLSINKKEREERVASLVLSEFVQVIVIIVIVVIVCVCVCVGHHHSLVPFFTRRSRFKVREEEGQGESKGLCVWEREREEERVGEFHVCYQSGSICVWVW